MRFSSVATFVAAVGTAVAAPVSDAAPRQVDSAQAPGLPQEPNVQPETPTFPEGLEIPPLPQTPEIPLPPPTPEVPLSPGDVSGDPQGPLPQATDPSPVAPIAQKSLFENMLPAVLARLPELIKDAQTIQCNSSTSSGSSSVTTITITEKRQEALPAAVALVDKLPGIINALEAAKGNTPASPGQGNLTAPGAGTALTARNAGPVDVAGILGKLPAILEALQALKGGASGAVGGGNTTVAAPPVAKRQSFDLSGIFDRLPAIVDAIRKARAQGCQATISSGRKSSNSTAQARADAPRQASDDAEVANTLPQLPAVIEDIEAKKGNYTGGSPAVKHAVAYMRPQPVSVKQLVDTAAILEQLPAVLAALNKPQGAVSNVTASS